MERYIQVYVGHTGDSSVVFGYKCECKVLCKGRPLTKDHKPESEEDVVVRIVKSGGKVVRKAGVTRVA
jgi:serine/threonine protein phosphatase PrpC